MNVGFLFFFRTFFFYPAVTGIYIYLFSRRSGWKGSNVFQSSIITFLAIYTVHEKKTLQFGDIYCNSYHQVFFIHSACLVTNSKTMSSSISLTCTPELASGISIRSQYSTNDSDELLVDGCWISSPVDREGGEDDDFFDTKTTSNLRRCKSLPITT